jgi:serine/threonine protein kinase
VAYTFKHGDRPLEGITVQRAVGRGGFGEVYYALADSGKQLALKYLRENPEIELRGIAHVMNLKSPHLITIYDVKRNTAGDPFVIMEYVSGPSLRELLTAQPGGLGVQKAAFFLSGIAKGLSYLHERGIVHRDLKPGNIFYDDGYVKIGDYGLSKHISVSRHSGQTVSVGTVHYMAPEIGSGSYTKAIDIYALGVILYEMLSGRLPYTGSTMAEILMRHLRDNPDLSGIPQPFAAVIAKALAKDPQDRYQDADEMLAAVMDSGDVCRSVEAFDASSLTQVPRSPEPHDADATVTSPRPAAPVPMLDVREAGPRVPLPPHLQRKLEQLHRRLEQRATRLERKLGPRRSRPVAPSPPAATPRVSRWPQMLILLVVTAAIATAMGALMGGQAAVESRIVAIALFIVGGTVGPVLTHLRFLQRSLTRNTVLDRLAYAAGAGLFMLPAFGVATDEVGSAFGRVIVAPLAAILVCNWNRRIEAGRLGKVQGGAAVWPAIVGLFAAALVEADQYLGIAAGICAAISLLTQATASMWPVATPAIEGRAPGRAGPTPAPAQVAGSAPPSGPDEHGKASAPPQGLATPLEPPVILRGAQPSFVGRAASAGVGFFGKLLLLIGMVIALGQGPLLDYAHQSIDSRAWRTIPPAIAPWLEQGVPPAMALVPLGLGSLLLVIARRRDGAWHFVRGCLGCALTVWGALMGMVWARGALTKVLTTRDWGSLHWPDLLDPLTLTILPLAIGIFLLLWPKARRDRPVVV